MEKLECVHDETIRHWLAYQTCTRTDALHSPSFAKEGFAHTALVVLRRYL